MKPVFTSVSDVDVYHCGFQSLVAPLVKFGMMSPTQCDFYFITSIPEPLCNWFFELVPESKHKQTSLPSILESISYLHLHFDTDSILWSPWDEETQSTHNNILHPQESCRLLDSESLPAVSQTKIEELSCRIAELEAVIKLIQECNHQTNVLSQSEDVCVRDCVTRLHRCFMCEKSGDELKHPLHPSRCTETPLLLSEGLIVFNRSTARYTLVNGEELPNVQWLDGGVVAFLRAVHYA